jgi:hypothetical protein
LKMTGIYGLYDPRLPDIIMYVGKGGESRPVCHWRHFVKTGMAVNALLRRWFAQLEADGVVPGYRFLEENVADWQKAERSWVACLRVINPALCNVAHGGNAGSLDGHSLGGKIGGRVQGCKNVENGHLASLRTKEHQSAAGKIGGRVGGPRCAHLRWHARRGIVKLNCSFCASAILVLENSSPVVADIATGSPVTLDFATDALRGK